MDEIVDYYVNPPSEEWDLNTLSKVKEFVYLLSDLEPSQEGSFRRRNQNLPA